MSHPRGDLRHCRHLLRPDQVIFHVAVDRHIVNQENGSDEGALVVAQRKDVDPQLLVVADADLLPHVLLPRRDLLADVAGDGESHGREQRFE